MKKRWLQCVGSRDTHECSNAYCSGVCCMYAIKEAVIDKEHAHGDVEMSISPSSRHIVKIIDFYFIQRYKMQQVTP